MKSGYLYVANRKKFIEEAKISAQSVRQFSKLPIALVASENCVDATVTNFFDIVIIVNDLNNYSYLAKIVGLQNSPFEKTIFLDSDTFVCYDISELLDLLEIIDIATTQESKRHTYPIPEIKYKNIFPEFNSGIIVFQNNKNVKKVFSDWLQICKDLKIHMDMPGLREAIILNNCSVKFSILPECYNSHGFKTMLMLEGEIKVIHERLGTNWKTVTPYFLPFEKMNSFNKRINKIKCKRIYIPWIGLIPYNYSPSNILLKFKKIIGIKRTSKNK